MSDRYILQSITEESYTEFSEELHSSNEGSFHLYITSGGGDTDVMWAFHDTILCSSRKIIGTATGYCHSAAPLILAACDVRRCTPNTEFMVHEDIYKTKGSPSRALVEALKAQASEDRWYTAMALLSTTSITQWRQLSEASTYFDAFKAKELGFIDKILPIRRGNKT